MKTSYSRDVLACIIIALPVFIFFYRFFFPTVQIIVTPDFGQSDSVISYSIKHFYAEHIKNFTLPLWTNQISGGQPLYASGIVGAWYIPNLVLFYLLPTPYAYILSLMLAFLLAGWGMYWWLTIMKLSRTAAILGGITFALSGYNIVQMTHMIIIQNVSLLPWFGLVTYLLATRKSLIYLFIFSLLLFQLCCLGLAQGIFIILMFTTGYYLWLVYGLKSRLTDVLKYLTAVSLGICAGAIQLLPSIEYLKSLISSGAFSGTGATAYSFPFKHVFTIFHPFLFGNYSDGTFPDRFSSNGSIFWENMLYIGTLPVLVFLIKIWNVFWAYFHTKQRILPVRPVLFFFLLVLIMSLLFMTGKFSPLYFIYTYWPFTMFRVPSRFIWVFTLALVVIFAFTLDSLQRRIHMPRFKTILLVLSCIFITSQTMYYWNSYHVTTDAQQWLTVPSEMRYLDPQGYTIGIGIEKSYTYTYRNGWKNVQTPPESVRSLFMPHASSLWNIPQFGDYMGRFMKRSKLVTDLLSATIPSDLQYATISAQGEKLLSLYAVKNVVSTVPLTLQPDSMIIPSHESAFVSYYTNQQALSKAYLASDIRISTSVNDAINKITHKSFQPGKSVLVETVGMQIPSTRDLPSINILSSGQGNYSFSIGTLVADAVFVLTETYYPGWHIEADGKEIPVYPVNLKHFGATIPAGTTKIRAYYLPNSFIQGRNITFISLFVIAIGVLFVCFQSTFGIRRTIHRTSSDLKSNRGN